MSPCLQVNVHERPDLFFLSRRAASISSLVDALRRKLGLFQPIVTLLVCLNLVRSFVKARSMGGGASLQAASLAEAQAEVQRLLAMVR